MKRVCIKEYINLYDGKNLTTIGKTYELIKDTFHEIYYFIADNGEEIIYFEPFDEELITLEQYREQQINKLVITK